MSVNVSTDALLTRTQQVMDASNAIADYRTDHGTSVRLRDLDAIGESWAVCDCSEHDGGLFVLLPPSISESCLPCHHC